MLTVYDRYRTVPDVLSEARSVCATQRVVKVDDLLDAGGGLQDGLELGQQLVGGDDGVHLCLVHAHAHPFLAQIRVEGHHGERVPTK